MREINLFNVITNWSAKRIEKKVANMKVHGICPDCSGSGVQMFTFDHIYINPDQCPGCDGSGAFEDWAK